MRKQIKIGNHVLVVEGIFNGITLLGAGISANAEEDDFRLAVQVWPFGLFLAFYSPAIKWIYQKLKIRQASYGRNLGFGISKGGVFNIDLFGVDKDGNTKPLVYLELAEMLGQEVYDEKEEEKGEMEIEMPEGNYGAEYRVFTSYWKRKFGFTNKMRRISIKMKQEIPVPAPGEPVRGVTMPFPEKQDLADAKIAFINSISHHRVKIGGKQWKPTPPPEPKKKAAKPKKKDGTTQKGVKRAKK